MRSKVHPKYKTKYRVGNWSAYEQALVQRGDVTLWLSADATDAWRPSPSGRPGAPKKFSDCAIETALTLRLVFRLPLRQAEGFLRSVLSLMGVDLAAPDHTTLSRRSQSLAVAFRRIPSRGPIHLIVDSTGLSIVGEGEWAAVQHGGRGHRGWKTLHLAVDRVGVIVAHALTEPTVDAATIGIDLIETVDDEIARVTADAAYDTVAFYEAAEMRDATVVVPPSKTARVSRRRPRSRARDRTITDVRTLGRRRWKKEAGYQLHVQRMQKALTHMNLLLPRVVSDIVGVTGLAILRDLVAGQHDPHVLAQHRDPRCQATPDEIAGALTGHYRPEHLFVLQQNLELFDMCQTQLLACDAALDAELQTLTAAVAPPTTPRRAAMNRTSTSVRHSTT